MPDVPLTPDTAALAVLVAGIPVTWGILAVGWIRRRRADRRTTITS